jgi:hypothetical protein
VLLDQQGRDQEAAQDEEDIYPDVAASQGFPQHREAMAEVANEHKQNRAAAQPIQRREVAKPVATRGGRAASPTSVVAQVTGELRGHDSLLGDERIDLNGLALLEPRADVACAAMCGFSYLRLEQSGDLRKSVRLPEAVGQAASLSYGLRQFPPLA